MPEISIIVPVYNTERFVSKCIESILGQSFEDFELILIDDGSTDQSGDICDKYAIKDSRVKVIHQKNRGVSAARNRGLDVAQGNYLYFVDSDDYLESNALEIIYPYFFDSDIDMVCFGFQYRDENYHLLNKKQNEKRVLTQDELFSELFKSPNLITASCYNKVYRRDKIINLRFDENISFLEDYLFVCEAAHNTLKTAVIPDCLYNVVERTNSATRSNPIQSIHKIIKGYEYLYKKVRIYDKRIAGLALNKLIDSCILYTRHFRYETKKESQNSYWMIVRLKILIYKYIISGIVTGTLTKAKVHRFLKEAYNA